MVEYIMPHDIVYIGTEFHCQYVYLWGVLCRLAINVSHDTQTIHLQRNCFFVDGMDSAKCRPVSLAISGNEGGSKSGSSILGFM